MKFDPACLFLPVTYYPLLAARGESRAGVPLGVHLAGGRPRRPVRVGHCERKYKKTKRRDVRPHLSFSRGPRKPLLALDTEGGVVPRSVLSRAFVTLDRRGPGGDKRFAVSPLEVSVPAGLDGVEPQFFPARVFADGAPVITINRHDQRSGSDDFFGLGNR